MEWIIFFIFVFISYLIDNKKIKKDYQSKIEKKPHAPNKSRTNQVLIKPEKRLERPVKSQVINDKKVLSKLQYQYKDLYKNIPIYLHSKGIYKFYHFTDIRNLNSIVENGGLYSWYGIQKRNIHAYLSSNELSRELDTRHGLANYIRLSFYHYHPMSSRLQYEESKNLVWLEIDIEVALWKDTLFSDRNATDNYVKVDGTFDFLKYLDLDVFKYEY